VGAPKDGEVRATPKEEIEKTCISKVTKVRKGSRGKCLNDKIAITLSRGPKEGGEKRDPPSSTPLIKIHQTIKDPKSLWVPYKSKDPRRGGGKDKKNRTRLNEKGQRGDDRVQGVNRDQKRKKDLRIKEI